MNNTIKIFLFEFKNKFKEKSIMISSIVILSMIFIGTFVPSIINNTMNKSEDQIKKDQIKVREKIY